MYSFHNLEQVCCFKHSSNCCFLTCIQISQEGSQVVWYSHLLKNFPQFAVIHTVKDFAVVNKAEVDVFLELSCFFDDPMDVGNLISGFIIGDWNAKVGSQETPGVTGKFGLGIRNEAGQRLTEFCQENAWVITNTLFQQHKRRLYTWTSPDGQHQNQIDYILCLQRI